MLAREVLEVTAIIILVKQAFSSGWYILDKRRSTMTHKNHDAQVIGLNFLPRVQLISTTEAKTNETDNFQQTNDFDDNSDFEIYVVLDKCYRVLFFLTNIFSHQASTNEVLTRLKPCGINLKSPTGFRVHN